MFGESESESPRVPSPWDSLISTPASSSPASRPVTSSSPPLTALIPKLVPEADDGNVEYKLQLLNPSASRFARLVTQLKWRLLEGGGQAYYELGVADSGALVGLPRAELEQSLETLEMMAGEIGASVIVVKEIEVPAALASLNAVEEDHRRVKKVDEFLVGSFGSEGDSSNATGTETDQTETEQSDEDESGYPVGQKASSSSSLGVFAMDPEPDEADPTPLQYTIDLEIASVFKPRPIRTRVQSQAPLDEADRRRRGKDKGKHQPRHHRNQDGVESGTGKGLSRRDARDRRREERRKALMVFASESLDNNSSSESVNRQSTLNPTATIPTEDASHLVADLESLHVSVDGNPAHQPVVSDETIPTLSLTAEPDEDDDVFNNPTTPSLHPHAPFQSSPLAITSEGAVPPSTDEDTRLIVEALVVRKMSLEEGFLDFGGFALI